MAHTVYSQAPIIINNKIRLVERRLHLLHLLACCTSYYFDLVIFHTPIIRVHQMYKTLIFLTSMEFQTAKSIGTV